MRVEIRLTHAELMEALENYLQQSAKSPYLSDSVGFPGINYAMIEKVGDKRASFAIGENVSVIITMLDI